MDDVFLNILNDCVNNKENVGISARITHKGKDIFRGAAGYADKEKGIPFTCDNLVRIFSMTKLITGVAALMLFEKGCYSLDEPLYKYLPAFKDLKVITYARDGRLVLSPAKNHVTIRNIFTMTAGFSYHILFTPYDVPKSFTDARRLSAEILEKTARTPNLTSEQMIEAIATIPMPFEPGTAWLYGVCSDILAALVAAISKKTFGAYLKEEIFDPLGMKDTCYRPTKEQLERLAVMYDYSDPKNVVPYDTSAFNIEHSPGSTNEHFVGALFSTLDDFSAFLQMLAAGGTYGGRRLIGENTIKLMASDQLTEEQYACLKSTKYPEGHSTWGLMCRVTKSLNNVQPYLFPGSFGWAGWAGTQAAVDPGRELTLTMMVQRVPSFSLNVMSKLMQTAYGMI